MLICGACGHVYAFSNPKNPNYQVGAEDAACPKKPRGVLRELNAAEKTLHKRIGELSSSLKYAQARIQELTTRWEALRGARDLRQSVDPQAQLFEVAAITTEKQLDSYQRKLTARKKAALARGVHPATGLPLVEGATCGECISLMTHRGRFFKCLKASVTFGPKTDVRKSWPACSSFQRKGNGGGDQ